MLYVMLAAIIGFTPVADGAREGSAAPSTPALAEKVAADEAFAQLKQMVGVWRSADQSDSRLRIRFYLTAGGTVLVESWEARGQPHSLTLYHRDGPALLATHYCPQGNQPRLLFVGHDGSGLHFVVRDVSDLDSATESHQHELWFDLADANRPVRSEIYSGKVGHGAQEQLVLVRDDDIRTDEGMAR